LPCLGSLDTCAPLDSATTIVSCRPGTCRFWYHNIKNILYKLVLNFYLKFTSSSMGLSRLSNGKYVKW
jgi:hypothetical protein